MPAAAREAALALWDPVEEADRVCREGALLTLAAPADVKSFAAWYLHEVARQIDGGSTEPCSSGAG